MFRAQGSLLRQADEDCNRKGAPSPLAAMIRRSTSLASVSPWRGAGAVWRQARSARVGTRHSHAVPSLGRRLHRRVGRGAAWWHPAHRGRWRHCAARLKSGNLCFVQRIGRIIPLHIWEAARMMGRHLAVSAGVRMMVLWWRCRGRIRGRRRGRDMAPPCRCLLPSCGHPAVFATCRWGGRRRRCACGVRGQPRPARARTRHAHRVAS